MKSSLVVMLIAIFTHQAAGQVVQLPSVQTFGTTGTVVVPDQGTAYMGGNRRLSSGLSSSGWGPLGTRAQGGTAAGSSVSVTATIIDLQAMDEALLNRAADALPPSDYPPRQQGRPVINTLAPKNYERMAGTADRWVPNPNAWNMSLGSPGDAPLRSTQTDSDVRYFMEQAAAAQHVGRLAAAKVYFQMAVDRMTPQQHERYLQLQERNQEAYRQGADAKKLGSKKANDSAARTSP